VSGRPSPSTSATIGRPIGRGVRGAMTRFSGSSPLAGPHRVAVVGLGVAADGDAADECAALTVDVLRAVPAAQPLTSKPAATTEARVRFIGAAPPATPEARGGDEAEVKDMTVRWRDDVAVREV